MIPPFFLLNLKKKYLKKGGGVLSILQVPVFGKGVIRLYSKYIDRTCMSFNVLQLVLKLNIYIPVYMKEVMLDVFIFGLLNN